MRYLMFLHISLGTPYYFVRVFFLFPLFLDSYRASQRNRVALAALPLLDDARAAKLTLNGAYPVFARRLQIACLLVLGVLRKVAEAARVLELLGDLAAP